MIPLKELKTPLRVLLLPPAGPLLLAFIGLLMLGRRPRMGRALIAIGLIGLWLLSTPWVADRLTQMTERYPALDWTRPTGAQAIVILGGGGQRAYAPEYQGASAEPGLLERLAYGAFLARKTGLPILVTGYRVEATAMRDTLQRLFDLPPRWLDDQSYDTFDNAHNSVQLLRAAGISRILLVTRGTHLWRATQEFEAAGMQVVPAPAGVYAPRDSAPYLYLPNPEGLGRSAAALYELLGDPVREFLQFTHLRHQ